MAIQGAYGDKDRISPHLIVRNAPEALEFYKRALGAVELYRSPLPGGVGMHFHLRVGKSFVMLTDEAPPSDSHGIDSTIALLSPQSLGGTTTVHEILVEDVDTAYTRAVGRGRDAGVARNRLFLGRSLWMGARPLRTHLGTGNDCRGIDARGSAKANGTSDGRDGRPRSGERVTGKSGRSSRR